MALFGRNSQQQTQPSNDPAALATLALNSIHDGVVIIDGNNIIRFINPAAISAIGYNDASEAIGMDCAFVLKFQDVNGAAIPDEKNELMHAAKTNQPFESRAYSILSRQGGAATPVKISLLLTGDNSGDKIITFRNIEKELAEDNEKSEFISTASHEMRTPVASIEGYLGLALNPQTATIDARARQYLEAAHSSSQHLGHLFQDLLDTTKLDDHQAKLHPVPLEVTDYTKKLTAEFGPKFDEKQLNYSFGGNISSGTRGITLSQLVYVYVDTGFLREIISNLIENAIKYTPEGGKILVAVQGVDNRAILSVADTGIGIGKEDLDHIFQKFYRVDNSQTRTIGGTGLGLYLVKKRAEAMGGSVWAESQVGKGTTFFVSLPRLTEDEYQKRKIALDNQQASQQAIA